MRDGIGQLLVTVMFKILGSLFSVLAVSLFGAEAQTQKLTYAPTLNYTPVPTL